MNRFLRAPIVPAFALLVVLAGGCRPPAGGGPSAGAAPSPTAPPIEARLGISWSPALGSSAAARARRGRDLDAIVEGGWRVVRFDFLWSRIESTPGRFDFSDYDPVVEEARARGIEILSLLAYGNAWATAAAPPGDHKFAPDDPDDFARFVRTVVAHYRGRIDRYEIWNEPNAGVRFWRPTLGGDAPAFARLQAAAARAVRESDPAAEVAFGGTFYPDWSPAVPGTLDFVEDAYRAAPDLGRSFDAFAYHPYRYPFVAPEERVGSRPGMEPFGESVRRVRSLLQRHGDGARPIWITETGWHTARWSLPFPGVGEDDQARYLLRSSIVAFAEGVELFIWYTLRDKSASLSWQEDSFGILAHDPDLDDGVRARRKPAHTASRTLARTLSGTRFQRSVRRELGLPEGSRAYRFEGPAGRVVHALWKFDRSADRVRARIPVPGAGASVRLIDREGRATPLAPHRMATGGYTVEVELSLDPVFVEY